MDKIITHLQEIAESNPDGFTVKLPDLQFIKKGWVVALKETQNCFGPDGLNKALEVAKKTSQHIGGWKDGKLFYWDCVQIFFDEDQATKAGIENEQLAIYQIETGRLKWLK